MQSSPEDSMTILSDVGSKIFPSQLASIQNIMHYRFRISRLLHRYLRYPFHIRQVRYYILPLFDSSRKIRSNEMTDINVNGVLSRRISIRLAALPDKYSLQPAEVYCHTDIGRVYKTNIYQCVISQMTLLRLVYRQLRLMKNRHCLSQTQKRRRTGT